MILNRKEILEKALIDELDEKHLRNGSYDLSTCQIIDMKGGKHDYYKLPPQGMAIVVFKERIKLTKGIIGFAHVKTSLTQKGIMATNIGIIDPEYDGYLSTLLINFGKSDQSLQVGEPCLRLTFAHMNSDYKSDAESMGKNPVLRKMDKYVQDRQANTDYLSKKFLNLNSVSIEVFNKVMKALIGLGIIFSAASFGIGMYFQNKTASEKDQDKIVKSYDIQNTLLVNQNNSLLKKLDSISNDMKVNEKRLKLLESKIKK
ncbi:hypothetical protein GCM10023149_28690 [Mucilaginibacter gynuensis]|uniref:dUTPase-like domain-containing protein n=1 Tax=Mucilaginibacter gynuensis TaxID=1302236 RepID=A0ABP8GKS0_9SPHI